MDRQVARYELVEGKSSKFWEVEVEGATLTVRFGRIGTDGQSKAKAFSDAAAAMKEKDKLVREKTGKGYAIAGEAPVPAAEAALVEAKPPVRGTGKAKPPPPSAPIADAIVADPPPSRPDRGPTEAATIFDGVALPSRMRPGPPLDPARDWAAYVALMRPLLADAPKSVRERAERLAARLEHEPATVDTLDAVEWVTDMLASCPEMDQRIYDAPPGPHGPGARAAFAHFARWLVARNGASRLVDCIELLQPRPVAANYGAMPHTQWQIPNAVGVRSALAAVPEADYDAAVATLIEHAAAVRKVDQTHDIVAYLAYVLADDRPGTSHDLRAAVQLPRYAEKVLRWGHTRRAVPLLVDLTPSEVADWYSTWHRADFSIGDVTAAEAAATAIAVAVQAGESPSLSLAWLLRDATGADKTSIAKALLDQRRDDSLPTLLPHVGSKLVRDALDAGDAAFPGWMLRAYLIALDGKGEAAYGPRIATLLSRHGVDSGARLGEGGEPNYRRAARPADRRARGDARPARGVARRAARSAVAAEGEGARRDRAGAGTDRDAVFARLRRVRGDGPRHLPVSKLAHHRKHARPRRGGSRRPKLRSTIPCRRRPSPSPFLVKPPTLIKCGRG